MLDIVPNWHPVLVHFLIALLSLSALLYIAGLLVPEAAPVRGEWHTVARWSLWLGFAAALAAVAAGWQAFNTVAHDEPSHAAMTMHRNWALATVAAYAPFVLWTASRRRDPSEPGIVFAVFLLLPTLLLAVTAHRGAELVYRHGLGVQSLPVTERAGGDGHGHDESGAHAHEGGHAHRVPRGTVSDAGVRAGPRADRAAPARCPAAGGNGSRQAASREPEPSRAPAVGIDGRATLLRPGSRTFRP